MTDNNHREDLLWILEGHGGPGFEQDVARRIEQVFLRYTSQIRRDAMGNLTAVLPGGGERQRPRVLLAAHMDEIALVVTKVEKGGFLRVWQAGGFDARTLIGQEVVVHGKRALPGIVGSKPPHLTTARERKHAPPLEDLYVDLALPESSVRDLVTVGDRVTLSRDPMELLHDRLAGRALDNRASVAVLLETLRFLRPLRHEADVYAVATVQEEVGIRGAGTAAYGWRPDVGIAIDVTFAEFPGQDPDRSFKMGKGPAISFGPNIHPKVFQRLRDTAEEHRIPYQLELTQGPTGTDARAIQITREGVATGLVGVAVRYMHTSVEMADYQDIVECGRLLAHFIANVDTAYVEGLSCY